MLRRRMLLGATSFIRTKIIWSDIIGEDNKMVRLGIEPICEYVGTSCNVTMNIWLWTKEPRTDSNNSWYSGWGTSTTSTNMGSVKLATTGTNWDVKNQIIAKTTSNTLKNAKKGDAFKFAVKFTSIDGTPNTTKVFDYVLR